MSLRPNACLPLAVVLLLAACAPRQRPSLKYLYDRLAEPLADLDVSSLAGARIVIDAGHGGVFRGARGVGGLDEADVNLGVALHLASLLRQSGAEVVLTRTADTDFVGGDSLRLKDDLRARVEVGNRAAGDLFISLHHNADLRRDRAFNELQVYYKMTDRGPSLDAARAVAEHLLVNLGEQPCRVIPGNYHVLRHSEGPAILCEPSYITNPQIESKLRRADKQRLEAEAYFLGVLGYFSKGVPRITGIRPDGGTNTALPAIEIVFHPSVLIDRSSADVYLDDTRLRAYAAGPNVFVAFAESPLAAGTHTIRASGRGASGNASREAVATFDVDLEPASLKVVAAPKPPEPVFPWRITATVLDENGNAVRDSTPVAFACGGARLVRPTVDGRACFYVGHDAPWGEATIEVRCAGLTEVVDADATPASPSVSGFVVDEAGDPIAGAAVVAEPGRAVGRSARDGYFSIEAAAVRSIEVWRPGFRGVVADVPPRGSYEVQLARLYSSFGPNATVTLDAEGGGQETGWVGPAGTTAAGLNLEICRRAAALLNSVGVAARLTRETDRWMGAHERLALAESFGSALLVSVAHAVAPENRATIGHYPGSLNGIRASGLLAEEMASAGLVPTKEETAEYLIQQTSGPAVKVAFLTRGTFADERGMSRPQEIWVRAYAIVYGILRYLGVEEAQTFSVSGRVIQDGKPCGDAFVLIDGVQEVPVGGDGRFAARLLETGNHSLRGFSSASESDRIPFDERTAEIEVTLR